MLCRRRESCHCCAYQVEQACTELVALEEFNQVEELGKFHCLRRWLKMYLEKIEHDSIQIGKAIMFFGLLENWEHVRQ